MFVCLFVCLLTCLFFILIILEHPQEYTLKISWRLDLIWLRYIGFWKMFICFLFVCLFIDLFVICFNHRETPKRSFPENFMKIWLDLADILRIRILDWKMFICLFVCLFVYRCVCFFPLIIVEYPQEVSLKISWRSDLIWLRY